MQAFYMYIVENNAWFYFEKVLLEGTSPGDDTLQQRKTVLQLTKSIFLFIFWVFEDLPRCNSYYTILNALREVVLTITKLKI